MESLVKAGAFDSLGSRGAVYGALDQVMAFAQLETRTRNSGQTSLFGGMEESDAPQMTGISLTGLDISAEEKAAWEKELLGVSLSYNPLMVLATADTGDGINSIDQLDEDMQGLTYTLLGHVATVNERYTKEQKKFLVVNFELLGGQIEVLVWPDVLERTAGMWDTGKLLRTTGKLRLRGDGYSLACDQVSAFVPPPASEVMVNAESASVMKEARAPAPSQGNGYSGNGNGREAAQNQQRKPGNGTNGSNRHQPNGSYRTSSGNGNGHTGNGRGYGANGEAGATTVSIANTRTVFVRHHGIR